MIEQRFEAYLPTPAGYAGAQSVGIHGIIPNSRRCSYADEVRLLTDLLAYLEGAIVVDHYVRYDVNMIDRSLERHGAGRLRNRVIDTTELARPATAERLPVARGGLQPRYTGAALPDSAFGSAYGAR